jgi:hypothetical protein
MDYDVSRAVNMIEQCKAPFPEDDFCERLSNEVKAKAGIGLQDGQVLP